MYYAWDAGIGHTEAPFFRKGKQRTSPFQCGALSSVRQPAAQDQSWEAGGGEFRIGILELLHSSPVSPKLQVSILQILTEQGISKIWLHVEAEEVQRLREKVKRGPRRTRWKILSKGENSWLRSGGAGHILINVWKDIYGTQSRGDSLRSLESIG